MTKIKRVQFLHRFAALILNQFIHVTRSDRRALEDQYHLGHGFFHRFIDFDGVNAREREPLDKVMYLYLEMEYIYKKRIAQYIDIDQGKVTEILDEYWAFRKRLSDLLNENFGHGIG